MQLLDQVTGREPGALAAPPPRAWSASDRWPLLVLAALYAVMLAASWQRWTQPIVDHGREMNLPARVLAGEQLYLDVQYLYGPFAPYFNAFLYYLFGIRLATLHVSGAVCGALIVLLLYWLARQLMSPREAALAAGLVLVTCAIKATGNYIQPYAYATLYGLVFALGGLAGVLRYLQGERMRWLCWAGVCAGMALISKPEIAGAAMAAAAVAVLLVGLAERRTPWREASLFALPIAAIALATYGFILSRVTWRTLLDENHVLFGNLPPQLIYFNQAVSGLSRWPKSFWAMTTGLGMLTFFAGLSVLVGALAVSRRQVEWQSAMRRALWVMLVGAAWWLLVVGFFKVRPDASPLIAAPLVLVTVIGVIGWRMRQSRAGGQRVPLAERLLLVISVFALVSLARVFLNVTTSGPYVPFFVPAVIIVYLYLLFRVSPGYLAAPGLLRLSVRRAAMTLIAVAIVAVGVKSAGQFRRNHTSEVEARRGRFLTDPALGHPFGEAIRFAAERTSPDEYVLVLPQGTMINFLAERRNPLRQEIVHPGFLEGENEAEAVRRIESRRVPLILVVNYQTAEFRDRFFGVDYNSEFMKWIREHYHLSARFGPPAGREPRLGDEAFFILAYERNA